MKPYDKIKSLCEENGIKITSLCIEITGNSGNLATWKTGSIRNDYLVKIAKYFGVTTDYLLGLSDVKTPPPQPAHTRKTLTDDELELLGVYRGLDNRGRYALHTKAYEEQDRAGGNRTSKSQESAAPAKKDKPKQKVHLEPGMIRVAARGGGGIKDVILTAEQAKAFNDYDEEVINKDWNI
jgi:hypothetical protein